MTRDDPAQERTSCWTWGVPQTRAEDEERARAQHLSNGSSNSSFAVAHACALPSRSMRNCATSAREHDARQGGYPLWAVVAVVLETGEDPRRAIRPIAVDLDEDVLVAMHRADHVVGLAARDRALQRESGGVEGGLEHPVEVGRDRWPFREQGQQAHGSRPGLIGRHRPAEPLLDQPLESIGALDDSFPCSRRV